MGTFPLHPTVNTCPVVFPVRRRGRLLTFTDINPFINATSQKTIWHITNLSSAKWIIKESFRANLWYFSEYSNELILCRPCSPSQVYSRTAWLICASHSTWIPLVYVSYCCKYLPVNYLFPHLKKKKGKSSAPISSRLSNIYSQGSE